MNTIWKQPLLTQTGPQTIKLPAGFKPLAIQMQHGRPMLWAICDSDKLPVDVTVVVYGTGFTIPDAPGKYVATWQDNGGGVWHAFIANAGK